MRKHANIATSASDQRCPGHHFPYEGLGRDNCVAGILRTLRLTIADSGHCFDLPEMLPMCVKKPHEIIRELAAERAGWSDDEVLAEIEGIPPLADERDAAWNEPTYWSVAYRYLGSRPPEWWKLGRLSV